ncbi:G-D-S-L family lipolytic protein [uncultured Psychroserpens sp.]|uniref:G-D-S-L family lipolytic protein n=1 Tax=uncultured Psychroserpens sp. TaxID=255436 RepID=UPI00263A18BA|nr:G-D-S-L family lipolytic protein [uncultured Psychroserpens sp.]
MKHIKYILLSAVLIAFTACSDDDDFSRTAEEEPLPALTVGSADFSNYVAIGASFTAGFSDGGLFRASQERSFPQLLSEQFAVGGGGSFTQPLMDDNTGGILVGGTPASGYRLVFGGAGPVPLNTFLVSQGAPVPPITTEAGNNIGSNFNNFGIPGAKSFHLVTPGYAAFNPFYTRIASGTTSTVLADALAQNPTFFTLSEVGGNDVLSYATSGGTGVDQTGNFDPLTYGNNDITDPNVFAQSFTALVTALSQDAKGVVTTVPDITSLSHFTTVPFNPLDPNDEETGPDLVAQIPLLNQLYGALNQVFAVVDPSRVITFSTTETNPVVVKDEDLADLSAVIAGALGPDPAFAAFIGQFGLPASQAPIVAGLLGATYGQARQANANDLFVLPSSSVIGTVNDDVATALGALLPPPVAEQFSVEGVTLPLEDKWVLTPQEQMAIATATQAYNATIIAIADTNPNVAVADLRAVLEQASISGYPYDDFTMTTDLVFGGLVSLDGIHLTSRGYGLMAREFLVAIDEAFGSNFIASGNTPVANDLPTNFSPTLQ